MKGEYRDAEFIDMKPLSGTERQVMDLLIAGKRPQEIADARRTTLMTVRSQLLIVRQKLNAVTLEQASAIYAVKKLEDER